MTSNDSKAIKDNVVTISRQQKRKQDREMANKQEQMRKFMNQPVPRLEFAQSTQKLADSFSTQSVMIAALIKVIIDKNLITKEEFQEALKYENQKQEVFKSIQTSPTSNYTELFDKCKQWDIPIWATNLLYRLKNDTSLTIEDKLRLADEYQIPHEALIDKISIDQQPSSGSNEMEEKLNEV